MSDDEAADKAFAALHEIFSRPSAGKSYRTYELTFIKGRPVFTLSEFDRMFEEMLEQMPSRSNEIHDDDESR